MLNNIPIELRQYRQWVVWRLEIVPGKDKPTKTPYNPFSKLKASVTNPNTWVSFDEACSAGPFLTEAVSNDAPIAGFHGIGFVFTESDPYGFIDLDDVHGDVEAYERQRKIYEEFNSYSEQSPSGTGYHILVRAKLPPLSGRRRAGIEIYSDARYATFTGNVTNPAPIQERQGLFSLLWEQMGGPATTYDYTHDQAQTKSDEEIFAIAAAAVNGEKFLDLYQGDWTKHYGVHNGKSQSEADFALVDILAYYSDNRAQISRLFLASQLGKREKAQRKGYINYMLNRCFDTKLPPVDISGLQAQWANQLAEQAAALNAGGSYGDGVAVLNTGGGLAIAPVGQGDAPGRLAPLALADASEAQAAAAKAVAPDRGEVKDEPFPPGLLGEIAQFIFDAAPVPVRRIALAGAIALMSGICGRGYNTTTGTGLNHYVMLIAKTGTGKEAIANGIAKLMGSIKASSPASGDFIGPGDIRSDAGLVKWIAQKPCFLSIVGEFGLRLQQMSSANASGHEIGLKRVLLDLYNKSGAGNALNPMAYSDKANNTPVVQSPAFSLLGESTPERFYGALGEDTITEGLLPRFTTIEYHGKAPYLNEDAGKVLPPFELSQKLATLSAQCLTLSHNNQVIIVQQDEEAKVILRTFSHETTDAKNARSSNEVSRELWNRAHIKAVKLASIAAVGVNPWTPLISKEQALWAIRMVKEEVGNMLSRFDNGDIGAANQNEGIQLKKVIEMITEFRSFNSDVAAKYNVSFEMHRDGVIPMDYISRRLIAAAAFKHDKQGATSALKRAVQQLLDADDLREVPRATLTAAYGKAPKSFVVANPARFMEVRRY